MDLEGASKTPGSKVSQNELTGRCMADSRATPRHNTAIYLQGVCHTVNTGCEADPYNIWLYLREIRSVSPHFKVLGETRV